MQTTNLLFLHKCIKVSLIDNLNEYFQEILIFYSVQLTVAPQKPKLEHEGTHILPGNNVTVDSGATATVKCVSHYGNPPAVLRVSFFIVNFLISYSFSTYFRLTVVSR